MTVYLSLGTNLGNRRDNIDKAITLLEESFGCPVAAVSDSIETPAYGFDGPDFLNIAARFDIADTAPEIILDICQGVERKMGRPDHEIITDKDGARVYESRIIDIDILYIDDLEIDSPRLTVPHKGIADRPFYFIPLSQIRK